MKRIISEFCNLCVGKDQLLASNKKIISELRTRNEYLEGLVNDDGEKIIELYDVNRKCYTHRLRQCVYSLLEHNVPASQVKFVLSDVLSMLDYIPEKLPSRTTVLEMNMERLVLAQKQLSQVYSNKRNTTLLTDETSKFGSKFMGYEARDEEGNNWVLGMRDIVSKSADDTLKVFK